MPPFAHRSRRGPTAGLAPAALLLLPACALLALLPAARAQTQTPPPGTIQTTLTGTQYDFSLDLSSLPATFDGYTLVYDLEPGDATETAPTQLSISDIAVDGAILSDLQYVGNAVPNGPAGATLNESFADGGGYFTESLTVFNGITPGDLLFHLSLDTEGAAAGLPAGFSLDVLSPDGTSALPTSDPADLSLAEIDFQTAGGPTLTDYNPGLLSFAAGNGGQPAPVPEAAGWAGMTLLLVLAASAAARSRARRA